MLFPVQNNDNYVAFDTYEKMMMTIHNTDIFPNEKKLFSSHASEPPRKVQKP